VYNQEEQTTKYAKDTKTTAAKAINRHRKIFFYRWPNVEKKLKSGFPQFAISV